ncbi:CST complex subunit STN1 [Psilocybe cubensis]|uniref:CST complex subunit STN1 n=2 Tax=Psilocybe cubensis TaxID=181762 RepID=A0A8H7Y677_PSICU|nr:CST complex subunit STN1 [Psilocybe cubensis]KAH9486978.1 CST complex subunit STN1 [Psilocybe cubensis]
MSFTFTSTSKLDKRNSFQTSTVYLTPTKRRRLTSQDPQVGSSIQDIYNWTFHSDAVAKCFVGDILELRPSMDRKYDFYWLKSVPCRSVKIVGMLVGIQVYEKRILYSVDDGTGVIDCYHALPRQYTALKADKLLNSEIVPPAPPPKPIATIGYCLEVSGTVREFHETRQLHVTDIKVCSSPNEELLHSKAVQALHTSIYRNSEPFIIPISPQKAKAQVTPSILSEITPSSVSSSPIKSLQVNSKNKSPIKLRHPSRLHSHDLTENTFRIYVKHFMDNAPITKGYSSTDDDFDSHAAHIPSTPTKSYRDDDTPRQFHSGTNVTITPKPRIEPLNYGVNTPLQSTCSRAPQEKLRQGVTLSFLRRVPELSLLAGRVVQAVGRRRLREEKQKLKDSGIIPSRAEKARILALTSIPSNKFAGKKKRLFQWAIIQLLKEGCLVHWDGLVCPLPETPYLETSRLWKTNITSFLNDDSNVFSTTAGSIASASTENSGDDGTLSDPDPDEEAYISLTADLLAEHVEAAIKTLVDHYEKNGKPYIGATKDGILSVLRKDDRWRHVGEWNVQDALELLHGEGKVWAMKNGRWDLTE